MRTIEEIKTEIQKAWMSNETLAAAYGFTLGAEWNFSRVSLENIIVWLVATAIWTHEKLFEAHNAEKEATKKFKKAQADYIAKVGNLYLADGKTLVTNYSGYQYNLNNIDTVVANYNSKATEVKTVKDNEKKKAAWTPIAASIRQAVDAFWNYVSNEKNDYNNTQYFDTLNAFTSDQSKGAYAAQYFKERVKKEGGCPYQNSKGNLIKSSWKRANNIGDFKNGSNNMKNISVLRGMCDNYINRIKNLDGCNVDEYGVRKA